MSSEKRAALLDRYPANMRQALRLLAAYVLRLNAEKAKAADGK